MRSTKSRSVSTRPEHAENLRARIQELEQGLKEARHELTELQVRQRLIADLTSDYASGLRVEPDGRLVIEWVTEGFERTTGYTLDELQANGGLGILLFAEDAEETRARHDRLRRGESVTSDVRIRTRSGETRWIRHRFGPIPRAQAEDPLRLIGAVQDITEFKRAEHQRLEAHRILQATLDALPQQVALLDEEGVILAVNRAWADSAAHLPASSEEVAAGLRAVREGRSDRFATQVCSAGGRSFLLQITRFEDAGLRRLVVSYEETTGLRKIERDLVETRHFLDAILEHAPMAIYAKTTDGRFQIVNRHWEHSIGLSRGLALGKRPEEFLPADIARDFNESDRRVLAEGAPDVRLHDLSVGSERRYFRTVKFPLRDAEGEVFGLGGVSIDLTDWKRSDDARQAALGELRALSAHLQQVREEEQTRISREVHDELGQALTCMKFDLVRLRKHLPQGPHRDAAVEDLDRLIVHVDSTIGSVRRIATGLRPPILDDFGLGSALEWLAEEFQNRTRIACTFVATGPESRQRADLDTALFRVAQEALTNVARHARATAVQIGLCEGPDACTLSIEDDGVGIPQSAIINPSLGIVGMRERVAQLGGHLRIERRERGTRVTASVTSPDRRSADGESGKS